MCTKNLRNELGLPSNTHSPAGRALRRVLHHSRPGVLDRSVLQDHHLSVSKRSLTPSTFPFSSKSRTSPFLSQVLFFLIRAVFSRHRSRRIYPSVELRPFQSLTCLSQQTVSSQSYNDITLHHNISGAIDSAIIIRA